MPKLINYPYLVDQVFGVPHYATRQTLDAVKNVLVPRMLANNISLANDVDDIVPSSSASSKVVTSNNAVCVIPVHGLLTTRKGTITNACTELTSYEELRSKISSALSNPNVKEIVLDINSGGGMATGCTELAEFIYRSRTIKPITAIVNYYAFSAAYYLAASCSKIILSQTSGVGSVGVILEHMEASILEQKEGLTFTTFYRGDYKNSGSVHEPLSDKAHESINLMLDNSYNLFTQSIAKYRNLDIQAVIDTQARCYSGQDAINVGFADELSDPQDAIDNIAAFYHKQAAEQTNIQLRATVMGQVVQL